MRVMRSALPMCGLLLILSMQASAQRRAQGSNIRVAKDEIDTTSASMTERNLTAHLLVGDSIEIQLAELAQTRATDPRVRAYAQLLAADHAAHLARTIEIVATDSIGAEALPTDQALARGWATLANLRAAPAGSSWDADFLSFQIRHHQGELDLWPAALTAVRDSALAEHMRNTQRTLAKHRDVARSVATVLGFRD